MQVTKGAKGKNQITKHLKYLQDFSGIFHFITDFLSLCFCSSFHALVLSAKVLYELHLQIGTGNAIMLILSGSHELSCHPCLCPKLITFQFNIRLQSLRCSSAFTSVCHVIMHGTSSK